MIQDRLLHELFEASVDRDPGRAAVVGDDETLSYGDLEREANRVAHWLRARRIGPEDRVGVLLPRGPRVYAAILGVLKAGAAYVPLDADTPSDRAAFMLRDCGAKALVTVSALERRLPSSVPEAVRVLRLDPGAGPLERESAARPARAETGARGGNLCYVIYTSGTTGRPKGVQIEHRNAVSLVEAESELYGARADDRILQFFSPAFDASVEEMWLAFLHGAALVAPGGPAPRPGPEFCRLLAGRGVTVLSCVPTFLAMLEDDLPAVRLLILGGEACPDEIARRWCRSGREVFNTYGPTEATVVATAAVLSPDKAVTIGRPISGYQVFLIDEELRPVPAGSPGEIVIAGPGVARGYLNRPELQAEKFVTTSQLTGGPLRLYRTGDLGRLTPEGDLEFLGRADGQVKIRGYRVELPEIEAALVQCTGALAAAAAVEEGTQRLAAYIVPRRGQALDRAAARRELARRLPAYMVPSFLDELDALPLTVSGKIDRRRLPKPKALFQEESGDRVAARTDAERAVVAVWESVLGCEVPSIRDDFFEKLGGHSMLAAVAVSRLRALPEFSGVSIADLYANPTAEALARLARSGAPAGAPAEPPFRAASSLSYRLCAAGQAAGVVLLSGLYAWQWLGAFLVYGYLAVADWPVRRAVVAALLAYLAVTPSLLALSIAAKWLLLGRIRPGRHPLWGWYYFRYWLARSIVHAAPVRYLAGTPWLNVYYRLMGARIGQDVYFGSNSRRSNGLTAFDVLTVADGASIGSDTALDGAWIEGGYLWIAPVTIGRRCWVGNRCAVGAGSVMEDGAGLDDLSTLPDGARIPAGQLWRGAPAAPAGLLSPETARRLWTSAGALGHLAAFFAFPLVVMAALSPGLMIIVALGHADEGYSFLLACPLIAASFILFLCLEAWLVKRLLIGRLEEGRYPVGGSFYLRKWFFDQIIDMSLEITETLYTTLYLRPWLAALGARVGPRSEIDAVRFQPDLFEAGPECFLGGDVLIGSPRVRSGWMRLERVRAGTRLFAGAGAVLPGGAVLGDNVLIGTLSLPPGGGDTLVENGSAWFGSPAIRIPARGAQSRFTEAQTYRPPRRLVALRLFIELFRVLLPGTVFVALASLIINATDVLQDHARLGAWLLALPFLYLAAGVAAMAVTIFLKKLLVGRYRAGEKPLWCAYVWRSELVNGVYANLCTQFFLDMLRGTPFIAWALRGMGAKIGRRCYIDTTWFCDFDLIEIGDEAALNDNATLLTQLFEGRVMKMGPIRVGRRCVLGAEATLQYDTRMGDGSWLGDMSLVMTGESLPAGGRWQGLPARPARARDTQAVLGASN